MKVGIIGAMEPEVVILREALQNKTELTKGGFTFYTGELAGHTVTLVQSGIGKVAATVATTLLIDNFIPDCVINTGSAGGFDPELNVGDAIKITSMSVSQIHTVASITSDTLLDLDSIWTGDSYTGSFGYVDEDLFRLKDGDVNPKFTVFTPNILPNFSNQVFSFSTPIPSVREHPIPKI